MANILYKTRGDANPRGKRRVYFTGHPEDFRKYFGKICKDIFKTHDCAIYYKEDMEAAIAPENRETDLGSCNLILVPVTPRMLKHPIPAVEEELAYANEKGIPMLLFMMEPVPMEDYQEKFGQRQYLNPYSTDVTEIAYEEKLRNRLNALLIDENMVNGIKEEFGAYIFLSYRKMDREYANKLMQQIHSYPEFLDVAIWYDEFLTPGVSFKVNIKEAMDKSKLFALLVTPNLLKNRENGKKNYVMETEYPDARKADMKILPVEMVKTDKAALESKFLEIPPCVNPGDASFRQQLRQLLPEGGKNDGDPRHWLLVGIAYMEGIDVETDRQRGLELITQAAEMGLPEAMVKLFLIYEALVDYPQQLKWARKLKQYYEDLHGLNHPDTLRWMDNLAGVYSEMGELHEAKRQYQQCYTFSYLTLGPKNLQTLLAMDNLAAIHGRLGEYAEAAQLHEEAHDIRSKLPDGDKRDELVHLLNLSYVYSLAGDARGLEKQIEAYDQCRAELGTEDYYTLVAANNLAMTYCARRDYGKAQELFRQAYEGMCTLWGADHPQTLITLDSLAGTYAYLGYQKEALMIRKNVYKKLRESLGDDHPDTQIALDNLAYSYAANGDPDKALQLREQVYKTLSSTLKPTHHDTRIALSNLAMTHMERGQYDKACAHFEALYQLQCAAGCKVHMDTLRYLECLADAYERDGKLAEAITAWERMHQVICQLKGPLHEESQTLLYNISVAYWNLGEPEKTMEIRLAMYSQLRGEYGDNNMDTQMAAEALAEVFVMLGRHGDAAALAEKMYEAYTQLLGADHPETERIGRNLIKTRLHANLCRHCGGEFTDDLICRKCGKRKDY